MKFENVQINEEKSINENKNKVNSDFWRQRYHIQPEVGLINDPNGFVQVGDTYHMFYQWNPLKPDHSSKYWGHVTSLDLLHWDKCETALRPDTVYTKNGVYSGSAIYDNEKLYLIYTGNVKDKNNIRLSYQCVAISDSSREYQKFDRIEPVVINQPDGYTRHIRDPKIWKHNDKYYFVIGMQNNKFQGKVGLYKSPDILNWEFLGEISGAHTGKFEDFGYMWECPDYFQLKDEITGEIKDILMFSPQGLEAEGDLYNNIYQTGYIIGKLDYENYKFIQETDFIEIDRGHDFYAPQSTLDNKNRRLLFGWMGIPEEDMHPTVENYWIHCLTLPRVLTLRNNKIYSNPINEMKSIRLEDNAKNISYNGKIDSDNPFESQGTRYELQVEFTNIDLTKDFGIKLRISNESETVLKYDVNEKKIILNRSKNAQIYKSDRKMSYNILSNSLKLQIFVDSSSVEIFIDNGKEVFSSRIYPDKYANGIEVFGDAQIKLEKWEWK